MTKMESKLKELAEAPELKNAFHAFLEAIRQDEKVIEAMIKEREDGEG